MLANVQTFFNCFEEIGHNALGSEEVVQYWMCPIHQFEDIFDWSFAWIHVANLGDIQVALILFSSWGCLFLAALFPPHYCLAFFTAFLSCFQSHLCFLIIFLQGPQREAVLPTFPHCNIFFLLMNVFIQESSRKWKALGIGLLWDEFFVGVN